MEKFFIKVPEANFCQMRIKKNKVLIPLRNCFGRKILKVEDFKENFNDYIIERESIFSSKTKGINLDGNILSIGDLNDSNNPEQFAVINNYSVTD